MPTYILECLNCGEKMEIVCKYSDTEKKIKCKSCRKKSKMKVVPSLGNFTIKGPCYKNGWDDGGDE